MLLGRFLAVIIDQGYRRAGFKGLSGALFSQAISTISFAAWVDELLVGMGTTVNEERYVEAYAYLGMYFSTLLEKSKIEFNKNNSAENAWEFYNLYQLLYSIRVSGENAYLKMCSAHGFLKIISGKWNFCGINDKTAFIEDTFDYMEKNCRFDIDDAEEIPEAHYYAQKAIISCPIDVEIYDKNGHLVYKLFDGKEEDIITSEGRFVCMYQPSSGEYEKIIYLNTDEQFIIKALGTDAGNVDIQLARELYNEKSYYQMVGLPILDDGEITIDTKIMEYKVDVDNDGTYEYDDFLEEIDETNNKVNQIELEKNQIEMTVGEKAVLGVFQRPANVLYNSVDWASSDEDVVVVKNGAIMAKSPGTATVTASIGDVSDTCMVSVSFENYVISYDLGGGIVEGNPDNYTEKTESFILNNPHKEGYVFIGWTGSNGDIPQLSVSIERGSSGDRSYIANWKQNQETFTIAAIPLKTYGDVPFLLTTEGGSGNGVVTYDASGNNGIIELNEDMVTIVGTGTVTITAKKAGDENYKQTSAKYELTVAPKTLTPVLSGSASKQYDGNTSIANAASNNLNVTLEGLLDIDKEKVSASVSSYEYADAEVGKDKPIHANGITLKGEAASNYSLSIDTATANVGTIENLSDKTKDQAKLTIKEVPAKTYGDSSFQLTTEGGSGTGAVTFNVPEKNGVLEIKDNTVTIIGVGLVEITATKDGDIEYKAAKATYKLTVEKKILIPSITGTVKKTHDGSTAVSGASSNTLGISLDGVLEKDKADVTATVSEYRYANSEVGTNKSVQASGITLQGKASSNYTLSTDKAAADVGVIESATHGSKNDTKGGTKTGGSASSTTGGSTNNKYSGSIGSTSGGSSSNKASGSTTNGNASGGSEGGNTNGSTNSATSGSNGSIAEGKADVTADGSTNTANKTEFTISSGSNKLTYKITSNTSKNRTVSLSSVEKISKKVVIPSTVKDSDTGFTYKVTGIANNVFKNRTELTSVIISSNIKTIGSNAFNGCSKLSNITIYADNLKKVGKNAFKGIMKNAVVKTEAKDKAHYNKIKKLLKASGIKNVKYKYRLKK